MKLLVKRLLVCVALLLIVNKSVVFSSELHDKYKALLENTTWVVPPSTLLAYQYSLGASTPIGDQTVWIIDSYNGGYFFGNSYTYLTNSVYSHRVMLGTITNEGTVYITFYPTGTEVLSTDLTDGLGIFVNVQGSYQFTMQMNSGSNIDGISHWSYMVSVKPGDPYYNDLPGVGTSIPEFLTNF